MCGRYTLSCPLDQLVQTFAVSEVALEGYLPRYNIAPTQDVPAIVAGPAGPRLGYLRWGLVPFWAEDPRVGSRMINARAESIDKRPAFREAFASRRCLVPADGFYEWKSAAGPPAPSGAGRTGRAPFWIHRPDRSAFSFAGVWERWRPKGAGNPIHSFAIVTTEASQALTPLHDRMPVVISAEARGLWLDPDAEVERLKSVLRPAPDDAFIAHAVSTAVNSPSFDEPACTVPVEEGLATGGGPVLDLFDT